MTEVGQRGYDEVGAGGYDGGGRGYDGGGRGLWVCCAGVAEFGGAGSVGMPWRKHVAQADGATAVCLLASAALELPPAQPGAQHGEDGC